MNNYTLKNEIPGDSINETILTTILDSYNLKEDILDLNPLVLFKAMPSMESSIDLKNETYWKYRIR